MILMNQVISAFLQLLMIGQGFLTMLIAFLLTGGVGYALGWLMEKKALFPAGVYTLPRMCCRRC